MNILKKIEEIRQQPEDVRMRWVWGSVAICMVIIFAIWIFSISAMFRKENSSQQPLDTTAIEEQLQNIKEQSASLKDYANQSATIKPDDTATTDPDSIGSLQNSKDSAPEIPTPGTYSDLRNTQ